MGKKYVGQTPSDDKDIVTKKYVDDSAGGGGDVTGPASSVDNSIARLDGVTGKVIQSTPHLTLSDDNKFESSTGTNIELLSVADIEISSGVGAAQSVNITADIDGVVSIKNDNLITNEISERTASSGVTIEGIRIKPEQIYSASDLSVFAYDELSLTGDAQVDIYAGIGDINLATATGDIELQANADVVVISDNLKTNIVGERTSGSGVTIDGTLIKDGLVDGRDPSVDGTRLDIITDANYKNSNTTKAQVGLSNVDNTSDASLTNTIISTIYPVGSLYTSTDATNPGTTLGIGTWVAFGQGRVLVGKDSAGTFSTAGDTMGTEAETLTVSQIPSHRHVKADKFGTAGTNYSDSSFWAQVNVNAGGSTQYTGYEGGGGSHNNIQPSVVVYMWKRTA